MKHKLFIVIILLSFLQALIAQNNLASPKNVSSEIVNSNYHNIFKPVTFSKLTILYSAPDTLTTVVSSLSFNTQVSIIGETENVSEKTDTIRRKDGSMYTTKTYRSLRWCKIRIDSTTAFAKTSDISKHTFFSNDSIYEYFFVERDNLSIYKYDIRNKKIINSSKLDKIRGDVIEKINISGWKNTKALFRVTQTDAFCGGGIYDKYFIDANNNFSCLFTTKLYYNEDQTQSYQSVFWISIKDSTGNMVLAQKGSSSDIAASFSDNLYIRDFPKHISVKKNELAVFKQVEKQLKKEKTKTSYYKWNGQKLVLIKNETQVK